MLPHPIVGDDKSRSRWKSIGAETCGKAPELLLHNPDSRKVCFLDLPSIGIGVEAVISHRDLALVRDMGSDPGDELQIVHPLHLFGLSPVPIAHLGSLFIKGEAFQGKERPDHVLSHPLSLEFVRISFSGGSAE
jgi:hypothetical protein